MAKSRGLTKASVNLSKPAACRPTVGPNFKNQPKMRFKKFVKLSNHTCACNDLTNFGCEAQALQKWKDCKFAESFTKNSLFGGF